LIAATEALTKIMGCSLGPVGTAMPSRLQLFNDISSSSSSSSSIFGTQALAAVLS
jgi:hypothetical protein